MSDKRFEFRYKGEELFRVDTQGWESWEVILLAAILGLTFSGLVALIKKLSKCFGK